MSLVSVKVEYWV